MLSLECAYFIREALIECYSITVRLASVDSDAILSVDLCRFVDLPSRTLFEASKDSRTTCGFWPADWFAARPLRTPIS